MVLVALEQQVRIQVSRMDLKLGSWQLCFPFLDEQIVGLPEEGKCVVVVQV